MVEDGLIGKVFLQNCGDSLKVIKKGNKDKNGRYLYDCEFLKHKYTCSCQKIHILKGNVNNPQIEIDEFVNKLWPQNCGDSLKIIQKVKTGKWLCEFLKYPFKIEACKQHILRGKVYNPFVFEKQEWKQKCGYTIIIDKLYKGKYICHFKEYPNITLTKRKDEIVRGDVSDFIIEQQNFIGTIWPQHCGDSLKVLEYLGEKENRKNWKCTFIKFPILLNLRKDSIQLGNVMNPKLEERTLQKELLVDKIKNNFKKKPTLQELKDFLNYSSTTSVSNLINRLELKDYVKYFPNNQQIELLKYIKSFYKGKIEQDTLKYLDGKEIDLYFPELKLGIEYNGNYWHCDKNKSNTYHQEKTLLALKKGIFLIHIWEWEFQYKRELIESFIRSKLGNFKKRIGARKCEVKEIKEYKKYADFCNENHLQGEVGARVKLGLYYNDELIQVMSFGVPRFTDKYEWEIIRECSKKDYLILGGKNKLWNYFVKKYNPNNCISYCDFSKFNGNSYLKLGFKKERLNKPGFVWLDKNYTHISWRNPYCHEKMKELYPNKIYDCGQLVFIWDKEKN